MDGIFYSLPLGHTVEAEAFGGSVIYEDEKAGERSGAPVYERIEELAGLPRMDLSHERIADVLEACRRLRAEGRRALLQVAGPFTILNTLIDIQTAYRAVRKRPEFMKEVFDKITDGLLQYTKAAQNCGVRYFAYGDAPGGRKMLGPKTAAQVAQTVTAPFLKRLQIQMKEQASGGEGFVFVCPLTAGALLEAGAAKTEKILLPEDMSYEKAAVMLSGDNLAADVRFAGQMCLGGRTALVPGRIFQALRLR